MRGTGEGTIAGLNGSTTALVALTIVGCTAECAYCLVHLQGPLVLDTYAQEPILTRNTLDGPSLGHPRPNGPREVSEIPATVVGQDRKSVV